MTTTLEVYTRLGVAQERKKVHDSSEFIYPMLEKSKGKHVHRKQNIGSFGTTSYSIDFAKKEGKPAIPRPCSVTRRNRPHPSQNFLNWRIPSSPIPRQESNETAKAFLNLSDLETKERFYDDYVGRYKFRRLYRAGFEGKNNEETTASQPKRDVMPPLCISKDAGKQYNSLVARTSSRERKIIESCLDAGDRGFLEKSLANAIQAEAIPSIHKWLKSQNLSDRNVAVGFLSNLSKSTASSKDQESSQKCCRLPPAFGKNSSAEISKAGRDAIIDQVRQMLPTDVRRVKERRRPAKCTPSRGKKLTNGRFQICPPRGCVVNKGALFMQPHRCLPGHFEIHPEF